MERDWTISELDEMFSDELEYLYPSDNPVWEEDEQETEEKENFKQINYLLDSEVIFTQEQLEEELRLKIGALGQAEISSPALISNIVISISSEHPDKL